MNAAMARLDLLRSWATDAIGLLDHDYARPDLAKVWQAANDEDGRRAKGSPYGDIYNNDRNPYEGVAARRSPMQKVHEYPESTRQPGDVTTGTVWTETLAHTTTPPMLINRAHFSPGARTCWHEHAQEQILIVENGVALVQEQGGQIEIVRAGQTVVCEPGVRHWHGAAPNNTMTQFAVTPADGAGAYAAWGEQVTDDEYNRFDPSKI